MALDTVAFAQPNLGLLSRAGLSGRDYPLSTSLQGDAPRSVFASEEEGKFDPVLAAQDRTGERLPFQPVSLTTMADALRKPFGSMQSATLGEIRERENRFPVEGQRTLYSPRGTPSDAIPAMTRLEARIAYEPVFMHHYASMRYEFVSRLPFTPAERRQQYNLLV